VHDSDDREPRNAEPRTSEATNLQPRVDEQFLDLPSQKINKGSWTDCSFPMTLMTKYIGRSKNILRIS